MLLNALLPPALCNIHATVTKTYVIMLIPITLLSIYFFSYTTATTHHDLHHHDHIHTADLHHDHLHVPELHNHQHTAGDLHTELHHHDVVQSHGDHLHHSHHDVVVATPHASGFWKKSFIWKPRWVKSWHEKKIYVPVWKHVWGPVQMTEWVPIPKPPPGWQKH